MEFIKNLLLCLIQISLISVNIKIATAATHNICSKIPRLEKQFAPRQHAAYFKMKMFGIMIAQKKTPGATIKESSKNM